MNDSNRTLRFPRTYREATGVEFRSDADHDFWDKLIAWVLCMGICFVIGVAVGMRMV